MLALFNRARNKRAKGEDGFTLIELLVVVVILGILIAIAIPVYLNYRKSANDKAAQSDVRNAISALEVCNSDLNAYPTTMTAAGTVAAGQTLTPGTCTQTIKLSSGTNYKYTGTATSYIMWTQNTGGSTNRIYCYSSAAGGAVAQYTTGTDITAATVCP